MVRKSLKQSYAKHRRAKAASLMRTGMGARRARRKARQSSGYRKTQQKTQRKYTR